VLCLKLQEEAGGDERRQAAITTGVVTEPLQSTGEWGIGYRLSKAVRGTMPRQS